MVQLVEEFFQKYGIYTFIAVMTLLGFFNGLKKPIKKYYLVLYHKYKEYKKNKIRNKFYDTISSMDFLVWSNELLSLIYSERYFTEIFGMKFPAYYISCDHSYKYSEFKRLYNKEEIPFEKYHIEKKSLTTSHFMHYSIKEGSLKDRILRKRMISQYKKIVADSIKYPYLPGYMLDRYELDKNKRIKHIYVHLGTYQQNIYTSHILEYELFYAYTRTRGAKIDVDQVWKYLPFRKQIHHNNSIPDILYSGINRYSLLGVQMFVMFYDRHQKEYVTLLLKRAQGVAAKPGYYQFIPSGGFEVYEKELNFNVAIIKEHFSLRKVIFREYLEEVFGLDEFKCGNLLKNTETTYKILNHPEIINLLDLIESQKASLELMGSAADLIGLRHELSFVLRVDDENFSNKVFSPNDEFTHNESCSSRIRIKLSQIEKLLEGKHNINPTSAALYAMVKQSKLYKEIAKNNFKKRVELTS